ncbi:MAG: BMP family protein [Anaerolineales bacterium]
MRKQLVSFLSILVLMSLLLTACGGGAETPTEEATEAPTEETTEEPTEAEEPTEEESAGVIGMITDMGGVDDKSFNEMAWKGMQRAEEELGANVSYLESQQQTDYATNITQYVRQEVDLIITVGFLLADATAEAAQEYPDMNFAIVDHSFEGAYDNARSLTFGTDQAGFLAGYAAADATETGIVATFGGINIPPVSIFMIGFTSGVDYYNEVNGTDVEVLGWSNETYEGVFVGNFESTDDGRRVAEEFLSEGADVIMPVAGPVGLGSAQAVQEHGDAWIIGVDQDWTLSAPEYADVILTSVMKNIDVAVYDTIRKVIDPDFGGFDGEVYVGTLENNGVGLARVKSDAVSDNLSQDLDGIKQQIIDGELTTGWNDYLASLGQAPEEPENEEVTVGMITDMGGVDDKSFNEMAWKGMQRAEEELGANVSYLESQQQTDYATNITQYVRQEVDLIITVGFLLADATAEAAQEYPDMNFAIVDHSFEGAYDNARSLTFGTDQAGFLAGYAAADATETGIVATFGGINIPPVSIFMIGFTSGVDYYNEVNGTDVEVLGWSNETYEGVFVGNFESTDDGRRVAEEFLSEGADVIMPVAGPVGLGSAQAVQEHGDAWIIGVDQDWTLSAPEYADVILTSVMKNINVAVFDSIKQVAAPDFSGFDGEVYVGTLENNGVGLGPIADGAVSDEVLEALDDVKMLIIRDELDTGWSGYLESLSE